MSRSATKQNDLANLAIMVRDEEARHSKEINQESAPKSTQRNTQVNGTAHVSNKPAVKTSTSGEMRGGSRGKGRPSRKKADIEYERIVAAIPVALKDRLELYQKSKKKVYPALADVVEMALERCMDEEKVPTVPRL